MDFISPEEHQSFLGATFVSKQKEIVLRVGTKQWTRMELVQHIGVGNMAAAAKLSSVLRKIKVTTLEQLYAIDPRDFALIPKLGETTIFVAMAVLKAEGFNVNRWVEQVVGAKKRLVTFRTLKMRSRRDRGQ
jgi:hypothetical protein